MTESDDDFDPADFGAAQPPPQPPAIHAAVHVPVQEQAQAQGLIGLKRPRERKYQSDGGPGPQLVQMRKKGDEYFQVEPRQLTCSGWALVGMRAAGGTDGKFVTWESIRFNIPDVNVDVNFSNVKFAVKRMAHMADEANFNKLYVDGHFDAMGKEWFSINRQGAECMREWGI